MGTVPQTVPSVILEPRIRWLGNYLATPRYFYVTAIPGTLIFAGGLSWVMGDEAGMVMASVVATAVAFFTLWEWLFRSAPTRFSTLLAMSLLMGYGTGALNTWITLPRGSLSLAEAMGESERILAHGLGAVLISSACLYFVGEFFEKPIFGRDFHLDIDRNARLLIYLGTFAMIVGYATHALDLGGGTAAGGHQSVLGAFLSWLYSPLTAIAAAAFLTAQTRRQKLSTGICLIFLLLMFSAMGRRIIIYAAMEILFVVGLTGYRLRGSWLRKIVLFLALGAVMLVSALTFMLFRIASYYETPTTASSITTKAEIVGKLVQRGGAYSMAASSTQSNFQTRTFVLAFLANVLDGSSRMTPALGKDALAMMQLAIPSVIYPDKTLSFSEEELVDQQFGFSYGDEANSILTGGATDFGFLGMIVYPFLVVAVVRLTFEVLSRSIKLVPLMFVTLALIYVMLQTEITVSGYVDTVRDTILFAFLLNLIVSFPRFRLRA